MRNLFRKIDIEWTFYPLRGFLDLRLGLESQWCDDEWSTDYITLSLLFFEITYWLKYE